VIDIPGGPNGLAVGPCIDGKVQLYVCNDGGFDWVQLPPPPAEPKLLISTTEPENYLGGSLQRVSLDPGGPIRDTLFTETSQPPAWPPTQPEKWDPPFPLRGPDDLVLDKEGGIWLSDFGKQQLRSVDKQQLHSSKDVTGVYYVAPDGSSMRQAIYPLTCSNGIALSPDGEWLYVALSFERRVLKYKVGPGGTFEPNPKTLDGSYLVTGAFEGSSVLDSMAVDAEGNLYVATMIPQGSDPSVNGGITVVSPDGKHVEFIEISLPNGVPCPLPSNICFGGDDMKTAYVTCGGSGFLVKMPAEIPGLKLNYNC
jgi:gluconolactonase